jgi:hypothetical protein
MMDIFDDPRLEIYAPRVTRYCLTCRGLSFIEEDGYLIDCPGPCHGTGLTDLPLPESKQ